MFRKVALLFLVLGFGGTVETAWRVREHVGFDPIGWRIIGDRFYGPSFSFDEQSRQALPAGAAIEVENGFGAVRVHQGAPGEAAITLRKVVFRPDEAQARAVADRLHVQPTLSGSTLRVGTNRAQVEAGARDVGFETHLEVAVPPGTAVRVRNEHGLVEVLDAGSADVATSYDAVRLERIAGDATVDARHSDVSAATVGGGLKIASSYGDVACSSITGASSVRIEHGDLTVTGSAGLEATVEYGKATLDGVGGDLQLQGSHSRVEARKVTGRARVATSYEDIRVEQLGGDADLATDHGAVHATDVQGALKAQASYEGVHLLRVAGRVDVGVDHGGVSAEALGAGGRIRASGDDVDVNGFRGPLEIVGEHAAISVSPTGGITELVSATTTYGEIHLHLPAGTSALVDATSVGGEARVEVPGFTITQQGHGHVAGRVGDGLARVSLRAEHGDVRVDSAAAVASADDEPDDR